MLTIAIPANITTNPIDSVTVSASPRNIQASRVAKIGNPSKPTYDVKAGKWRSDMVLDHKVKDETTGPLTKSSQKFG